MPCTVPSGRRAMARRDFMKMGALALGALGVPSLGAAQRPARLEHERRLAFYNTHTTEAVDTVYWAEGGYVPEGLRLIDRVMRDHRTGAVQPMDRRLLDLLFELRTTLGT